MPLQNRVTPLGELIETPERGLVYGNRGRLHDEQGNTRRQWQVKRWISCRLEFRGRHRPGGPMAPNRYTGRPLLPRRSDRAGRRTPPLRRMPQPRTKSFLAPTGASRAGDLDETLHAERGRLHRRPRFSGRVRVATPPTRLHILASGLEWKPPLVHPGWFA